ncbi:MAG: HNH endonuclease [Rhizobiales bacterium]|nr:HNH endonuclease [Hyphomicrobiales bacterium]
MPLRPPSACRKPGCRGLVRDGVCSVCGPLRRAVQFDQDARRGTAARRGYGSRWQRVRMMYLQAHPLCAMCEKSGRVSQATDVHHVEKKRDGGPDMAENLMALCHVCHSKITAAGK